MSRQMTFSEHLDDLRYEIMDMVEDSSLRRVADAAGVNFHSLDAFLLSEGQRGTIKTVAKLAAFVEENA